MTSLLFSRVSIFDVLQHQQQTLKAEVDRLDSSAIERRSEEELVQELAAKYKIEIPVLEEDKAYTSHREVDVDVSGDPMRMIWDRSKPFYIKGIEVTISIPFRGHPDLFRIQPSRFNLNPPRGEICGNEIHLIYTRTDANAAGVKADYEQTVQDIKQYLSWLGGSVADFNSKIGLQVQSLVVQRRQRLAATANMIAGIGLPVVRKDDRIDAPPGGRKRALSKNISSPKKWDVFICHASEDKAELAHPLATELRSRGISVWYDEFSLRMGDSLRSSIEYGLANSRYGIVILSKNFFAKHWPVQELNGLAARERQGRKVILPIWHKLTVEEVCAFSPVLADRLASRSDEGVEKLVEDIVGALDQD